MLNELYLWVIGALWGAVIALITYIAQRQSSRISIIENNVENLKKEISENEKDVEVIKTKIDGLSEVVDAKLAGVHQILKRIEEKL